MDRAAQSVDPYFAQESMDCAGICGSRLLARSTDLPVLCTGLLHTQHRSLLNLYAYTYYHNTKINNVQLYQQLSVGSIDGTAGNCYSPIPSNIIISSA